jgi:hypothetical protein
VETFAGVVVGLASALFLAPFPFDVACRRTTLALAAAASAALVSAFGATVVVTSCSSAAVR